MTLQMVQMMKTSYGRQTPKFKVKHLIDHWLYINLANVILKINTWKHSITLKLVYTQPPPTTQTFLTHSRVHRKLKVQLISELFQDIYATQIQLDLLSHSVHLEIQPSLNSCKSQLARWTTKQHYYLCIPAGHPPPTWC